MDHTLGQLLFLLYHVAVIAVPLLAVIWFARTLDLMRRNQAASVRLLAAIEAELRAARIAREGSLK